MGVRNVHATIFCFELVERRRAQACLRHTSAVGIPASCSLIIPIIWASVKRLCCILFAPSKDEQTLH
jgi:hypothetical protein